MLASGVHEQTFSDAPTVFRERFVEDNAMCFARGATQCTQTDCNVPLNVSLAPPLSDSFQIDLTVRLEPDSTGVQQGGYLYARSLVLPSSVPGPRRFFALYARPRQQGLRLFYATLNSVVQEEVAFPTLVLDDGAVHNISLQVHQIELRGSTHSMVVAIVDGSIVQRHVLVGLAADCGGSQFADCVTYLGGRAVEGIGAGPGLTAFEMNGCMSEALLIEPSRSLPTIPPQLDLLAGALYDTDISAQRNTLLGEADTCIVPVGATAPPGFGPPLTANSIPLVGVNFAISVRLILPTEGYGYILAKSGSGSLRYYSLYVRRTTGHLLFYYKAVGVPNQQFVTLTDFSIANGTRVDIDVQVVGTVLTATISSAAGAVSGNHQLVGLVDDCIKATPGNDVCSLHLGERAGGRFPLQPFGCISRATLFPDGQAAP